MVERLCDAIGELDRAHHAYTHAAVAGYASVDSARSSLIETRERVQALVEAASEEVRGAL